MNDLPGLSIGQRRRGTQNLVTDGAVVERSLQRWSIQATANAKANCDVPSRIAAFELIQEPKGLLRNGRGEPILVFAETSDGCKGWGVNLRWVVFCFHGYIERVVAGCM